MRLSKVAILAAVCFTMFEALYWSTGEDLLRCVARIMYSGAACAPVRPWAMLGTYLLAVLFLALFIQLVAHLIHDSAPAQRRRKKK